MLYIFQSFDIHAEVYYVSDTSLIFLFLLQLHVGPTVSKEARRNVTKRQATAIGITVYMYDMIIRNWFLYALLGELLLWSSSDWETLKELKDPVACLSMCLSSVKTTNEASGIPQTTLQTIYERIRSNTIAKLRKHEETKEGRVMGMSALEGVQAQCGSSVSGQAQCGSSASMSPKDILMLIPIELSTHIMSYLDAQSLNSLSMCSKFLQRDCHMVIPGLLLRLYPHQYNSGIYMCIHDRYSTLYICS